MVSNTSFKTKITSWGWAADTGGPWAWLQNLLSQIGQSESKSTQIGSVKLIQTTFRVENFKILDFAP